MKKIYLILIIAGVLVLAGIFIVLRSSEDSWMKNEKGVWIEHGAPSEVPAYVLEQQDAVECALELYNAEKGKGVEFLSQCLGVCGNYAVDIVHVPRTSEDNLIENQCEDYRSGKVKDFIELDKDGNVVRVVD